MGMFKEFKEFAVKGNVVDLAVGVIIGAAFGKIVSTMVDGVLMPVIGKFLGGVNFTDLEYTLTPAVAAAEGTEAAAAVVIKYGALIQTTVDFTIVAFVLFLAIKAINNMKKAEAEAPAAPAAPPADVQLLTEIRDLLKK